MPRKCAIRLGQGTLSSGGRTVCGAPAAAFNPGFLTGGRDDVLGKADALPGPLRIPDRAKTKHGLYSAETQQLMRAVRTLRRDARRVAGDL